MAKIARQQYRSSRSPAVPENNDARMALLLRAENAITIGIQQPHNNLVRLPSSPVFENPNVGSLRTNLADFLRKLYRTVMLIVGAHESSDKSNHNVRWTGIFETGNPGFTGLSG